MPKINVFVTDKQKDFLELIVHTDGASSIGGAGEYGNAVQWCIDACIKIEERYKNLGGADACYIGFHGTPVEEELSAALSKLVANPHGCRFCDSGKLRTPDNPAKDHDDDCPYKIANEILIPIERVNL